MASDPGDVVLDCFLGSGTTAACAQKMGRRWVGVEWSQPTIQDFILPRLNAVIAGEDSDGITKAESWAGGGGFRVVEVAPSMFQVSEGRVVLADWAVGGVLAEAVAAQAGFSFVDEPPFSGRKGRQRLAVIDGLVNEAVIRLLLPWLRDAELLTVYGTAVDPDCRSALSELRRGSVLRKMPESVLDDYRRAQQRRAGALEWPPSDSDALSTSRTG
jgi:adenine-specific DNA-methyltransferase